MHAFRILNVFTVGGDPFSGKLGLRIDERDQIFVTGSVIELGRGTIAL